MEEKNSFIFYRSFYNALQKVKDRDLRLDIFEAVCELGLNDNVKELDSEVGNVIMELISPQLEANTERYINSKKGGAPKGNQNAKKQKNNTENNSKNNQETNENQFKTTENNIERNFETTESNQNNHRLNQKQPNVNVNVNDNYNVNDNVNVNLDANVNDNVTITTKEEIKEENKTTEIKNLKLIEFYEKHFGRTVSATEVEILETWKDTELTRYAIKQAELARAFNIKYVQSILNSYFENNIQTVAEAEARQKQFKESKNKKSQAELEAEAKEQFLRGKDE